MTVDVHKWHDGFGNRGAANIWYSSVPISYIYSYNTKEQFTFEEMAGRGQNVSILHEPLWTNVVNVPCCTILHVCFSPKPCQMASHQYLIYIYIWDYRNWQLHCSFFWEVCFHGNIRHFCFDFLHNSSFIELHCWQTHLLLSCIRKCKMAASNSASNVILPAVKCLVI